MLYSVPCHLQNTIYTFSEFPCSQPPLLQDVQQRLPYLFFGCETVLSLSLPSLDKSRFGKLKITNCLVKANTYLKYDTAQTLTNTQYHQTLNACLVIFRLYLPFPSKHTIEIHIYVSCFVLYHFEYNL